MGSIIGLNYVNAIFHKTGTFMGCCVNISQDGYVLTAKHVIDCPSRQDLLISLEHPSNQGGKLFKIENIICHDKYDIAIAKIANPEWQLNFFPLRRDNCSIGEDVCAIGFVEAKICLSKENKRYEIEHEKRYCKGYISSFVDADMSKQNQPAYELSFEVLRGLSGAPLLQFNPKSNSDQTCIAGLLYGSGRSETIDDIAEEEVSEDGKVTPKIVSKRIISFGLAHPVKSIIEIPNINKICSVI